MFLIYTYNFNMSETVKIVFFEGFLESIPTFILLTKLWFTIPILLIRYYYKPTLTILCAKVLSMFDSLYRFFHHSVHFSKGQ